MRWSKIAFFALLTCGCLTLTPKGAGVAVYQASLDDPPAKREMPDGCRKVATVGEDQLSEATMEGQADPYRRQRNVVGDAGGNVLLVLRHQVSPRNYAECPKGMAIGDCPGHSGAVYKVTFESYECTPEALKALAPPKNPKG